MCDATLKPLHLHKRGQQDGGRTLGKRLTSIYSISIKAYIVLAYSPRNKPELPTLAYSRVLTWVVEALLTTLVEGLEDNGGVLASTNTMVKVLRQLSRSYNNSRCVYYLYLHMFTSFLSAVLWLPL